MSLHSPKIITFITLKGTEKNLGTGQTGQIHVYAKASNPDKNSLVYEWLAARGTIQGKSETVTYKAPDVAGEDSVTVIVKDTTNRIAVKSTSFSILPVGTPAITLTNVDRANAKVTGTVANIDPTECKVIVYVSIHDKWYIQPFPNERANISIKKDGSWHVTHVH